MNIEEQRNMMERALGERMLNHAFVFLRQWCKDLGYTYSDRIQSIEQNYKYLFDYYLSADDPERDRLLNEMTSDTYRLMDTMYADLRIKQGLVPELSGFDHDNMDSALRYFTTCVHLQDEDFDYLLDLAEKPEARATTLMVMAALVQNQRNNFSEPAIMCLIRLMNSDNALVRDQAIASVILLLAHYDVRIDYFPDIQNAFLDSIESDDHAFEILCALTKSTKESLREIVENEDLPDDIIPDEIKGLFGEDMANSLNQIVESFPSNEEEYIAELIALLPNTWVFDVLVGEDSERIQIMSKAYLNAGLMEMMWDKLDEAEEILVNRLRSNHPLPQDYINYGHICFLRGDRLLAYENYREARNMLKSAKKFLSIFRPDRRNLVEKGIAIEEVYLMEDRLLDKE